MGVFAEGQLGVNLAILTNQYARAGRLEAGYSHPGAPEAGGISVDTVLGAITGHAFSPAQA